MSRVMELQAWRPGARRKRFSPESRAASTGSTAATLKTTPSTTAAWDPYEVWLTRVKQPRDQSKQNSGE